MGVIHVHSCLELVMLQINIVMVRVRGYTITPLLTRLPVQKEVIERPNRF